jgi:hypothetical protein
MLNFCTLFDSNYLSRGLALFESLKKTTTDFHLFVVAFDEECYDYLRKLDYKDLTPVSLTDFEDEKLKRVKSGRTTAEYCWTCTPSIILYCVEKFQLPSCTYVDADMIFYQSPQILFDELTDQSIIISEHRYTRDYDVSATHGIYCVQFMYFKNDQSGLNALSWWRDRCIEWCFAYLEDGKFGDQKYLDDWRERFPGVHVMQNPGGGLAPWNIQQYLVEDKNGRVFITDKQKATTAPMVFYHFHGLKFYSDDKVACCGALYEIDKNVKEILYFPYIRHLLEVGDKIVRSGFKLNPQGARQPSPGPGKVLSEYIKNVIFLMLKGRLPLFKKSLFKITLHNHIYKLSRIKK